MWAGHRRSRTSSKAPFLEHRESSLILNAIDSGVPEVPPPPERPGRKSRASKPLLPRAWAGCFARPRFCEPEHSCTPPPKQGPLRFRQDPPPVQTALHSRRIPYKSPDRPGLISRNLPQMGLRQRILEDRNLLRKVTRLVHQVTRRHMIDGIRPHRNRRKEHVGHRSTIFP